MGAGIAEVFARNGFSVVGVELNDEARRPRPPAPGELHRPRGQAREAHRGRGGRAARPDHAQHLDEGPARGRLRGRGGRRVAGDQEEHLPASSRASSSPDAILATNTSCLSVTEISTANAHPGRVIGVHFFNPAPVQNLVEIVRTVVTEPQVLEDVTALVEQLGKNPVVCGDKAGFIANTLLFGYLNHAVSMFEGKFASREDIDAAMRFGCGYPMGPLQLLDLIGLDTAYEILETMYRQGRDRLHAPAPILKQLVTAGMLGRKTGRGFYTYDGPDSPVTVADDLTPSRRRQAAVPAPDQERRRGRHRHHGQRHRRGLRQGRVRRALRRPQPGQGRRRRRRDHQELRQADPARPGHRGRQGRRARPGQRLRLARRPQGRRHRGRGDRRGPRRSRTRCSATSTTSASPARSWPPRRPRCR